MENQIERIIVKGCKELVEKYRAIVEMLESGSRLKEE